jgi:hypothetical protein
MIKPYIDSSGRGVVGRIEIGICDLRSRDVGQDGRVQLSRSGLSFAQGAWMQALLSK